MTDLQTTNSAVYLQSGWPARSPGLLRWFWSEVGWRGERLRCLLLRQESPCFLLCFQQCCPLCSGALRRASASRLIHQTLEERVGMVGHQINNTDYKPANP